MATKVIQANKHDPTRTKTLRNRWIAKFNKRYKTLKGQINDWFARNSEGFVANEEGFQFLSSAEKVTAFMLWLEGRVQTIIIGNGATPQSIWQNQYIDRAYLRGLESARRELRRAGASLPIMLEEVQRMQLRGTATPALSSAFQLRPTSLLERPIHLDAIQLLHTRDYAALQGITTEMSNQIGRVLADGIEEGLGADELAKNINDRVDKIGLTRSKLLARTETVRAYNVANINEARDAQEQFGLEISMLWQTSLDERVRNTHADRQGRLYTEQRAMALIGEPNCRCSVSPYVDELDTPEKRLRRKESRQEGEELIK